MRLKTDWMKGTSLSSTQRLCIARAISVNPDVILMDEPCSALDPIATAKIEALMEDLKKEYTIIIVFLCNKLQEYLKKLVFFI